LDKKTFRRYCLNRLKCVPQSKKYIKDNLVTQKIAKLIALKKPKSILFYLPMNIEVDVQKLMRVYRRKLKIFVPFIEGESFKMVQYRLPLKSNSLNILEPPNSQKVTKRVDMIIVPVVGVDGDYRRVGFGKGMYDRFYEKLKSKPVTVFVQRKRCKTQIKVTDSYDIQADYYITPKELIDTGKHDDNRDYTSRYRCLNRRCCRIF
jgi:5-formyltetrahydrofolate cyclo-ligase